MLRIDAGAVIDLMRTMLQQAAHEKATSRMSGFSCLVYGVTRVEAKLDSDNCHNVALFGTALAVGCNAHAPLRENPISVSHLPTTRSIRSCVIFSRQAVRTGPKPASLANLFSVYNMEQ